jgi:uncharacterized Zn finger protein (UPF0148 family)
LQRVETVISPNNLELHRYKSGSNFLNLDVILKSIIMASLVCPKCKSHLSGFDLFCMKCGYTITPEERIRLEKELEEQIASDEARKLALHEEKMKQQKHPLQKKLDKLSYRFLHVRLDFVIVFVVAIFLLIIAAFFMLR